VVAFINVRGDENFPTKLSPTEVILLGSKEKIFNKVALHENFENLPHDAREYLRAIWINSADDLEHILFFTEEDLRGYVDGAEFVTDDNARLEFSTSKSILFADPKAVISDIENFIKNKILE